MKQLSGIPKSVPSCMRSRHTTWAYLPSNGLCVGTGVLIRHNSNDLTANHNFEGTIPCSVRFAFFSGGPLREGAMTASTDLRGFSPGKILSFEADAIVDNGNDIAVVRLRKNQIPSSADLDELNPKAPRLSDGATIIVADSRGIIQYFFAGSHALLELLLNPDDLIRF